VQSPILVPQPFPKLEWPCKQGYCTSGYVQQQYPLYIKIFAGGFLCSFEKVQVVANKINRQAKERNANNDLENFR
jgi:hypothetical protein